MSKQTSYATYKHSPPLKIKELANIYLHISEILPTERLWSRLKQLLRTGCAGTQHMGVHALALQQTHIQVESHPQWKKKNSRVG